jgi:hypothetical protein
MIDDGRRRTTKIAMTARTAIRVSTTLFLALGAAVSGAQQRAATQQSSDAFVLERGRAGQFELGMTADEVYRAARQQYVRLVATFPEGMFQPVLQIEIQGSEATPALTAPIREWPCAGFAIWGISVHDARFRTKDGLGVGSTLGDLRRVDSAAKVSGVMTDSGPVVVMETRGLTFRMDPAARSFTDDSRVTSVWVIPDPVAVRARRCPDRRR